MKISTRQYLKDIEKAYKKGREHGVREMYDDRDRRAAFDRFEANMRRLEEHVEQLHHRIESTIATTERAEKPAPAVPAGDTEATFF